MQILHAARGRSFLRVLAVVVLAAGLVACPSAAPEARGVEASGPLPECRFDDIPTVPRDYEDGPITLVDHILTLGRDYEPPDLMPVGEMGLAGGGLIRRIAARDTREMAQAAADNGTPIGVWSGYRSFRTQRNLYKDGVAAYGVEIASLHWARKGHSEHQLGLGVDFMTAGGGNPLLGDWSTTPAGAWMEANAWKYGWVMSYPKGKTSITCFNYEPWHYRYVGLEVAARIHDSGVTIREYLWQHYTLVDPTTGEPLPTGSTAPSAGTSPDASPEPAPSSVATGAPGIPTGRPASPQPTPPAAGAGTWFGLEPPLVILGGLLLLALAWLATAGGRRRRSGRR
jgi:zinc D-Ala-D-Ala carboxypeptidase